MRRSWGVGLCRLVAVVTVGAMVSSCATVAAASQRESPENAKASRAARAPRLVADIAEQAARGRYPRGLNVGDVKTWPAWTTQGDGDFFGSIYLKDYTLRGISEHLEVWVASGGDEQSTGLDYPPGDCRNGLATTITDDQVAQLVDAFETEIRPALQPVFPDPRPRDGKHAALPRWIPEIPSSAFRGAGDRTVVLVDNFREPGFTAPPSTLGGLTLGFMFPSFINMTDRNVLSLRGSGWAWRLGDDPLPTTWTGDPCTTRVRSPNTVEEVLAHEYAHVVQASAGAFFDNVLQEPKWLTEGSADWAVTLTPWGARSRVSSCFLGHGAVATDPADFCPDGPQTSLTTWGDATPGGDYGAGATFVDLLAARFGPSIVRDLVTRTDAHGIDKVNRLVSERGSDDDMYDLIQDWAVALAASGVLADGAEPTPGSGDVGRYELSSMPSVVEWDAPGAFDRPGIAPNGSDFVRLRDATGSWLTADDLVSLDLAIAPTLDGRWTTDGDVFHSGTGDGVLRRMAREVSLPAGRSTIDFDARWDIEPGWDFGYVQVSLDGETWRSLATQDTTSAHDPDALPEIVAALPGFTGASDGWTHQRATIELDHPADVLVAFTHRTDELFHGGGFWVDDVVVNDALIGDGTTLTGWKDVAPPVDDATATIVSYTDDHDVIGIAPIPLGDAMTARLDAADLQTMVARGAETVAVIVTHTQRDLTLSSYAPYRLSVNGVLQPGGSSW
jgi:hypothetical protein